MAVRSVCCKTRDWRRADVAVAVAQHRRSAVGASVAAAAAALPAEPREAQLPSALQAHVDMFEDAGRRRPRVGRRERRCDGGDAVSPAVSVFVQVFVTSQGAPQRCRWRLRPSVPHMRVGRSVVGDPNRRGFRLEQPLELGHFTAHHTPRLVQCAWWTKIDESVFASIMGSVCCGFGASHNQTLEEPVSPLACARTAENLT